MGSGGIAQKQVREIMNNTTYETPELTELGILNVDTLSSSGGGKKGGGKKGGGKPRLNEVASLKQGDHGGGNPWEECRPPQDKSKGFLESEICFDAL